MRKRTFRSIGVSVMVPGVLAMLGACQETDAEGETSSRLVFREFPSGDPTATGIDVWDLHSITTADGRFAFARGYRYLGEVREARLEVMARADGVPNAHVRPSNGAPLALDAGTAHAIGRDLDRMAGALPVPDGAGSASSPQSVRILSGELSRCDSWSVDAGGGESGSLVTGGSTSLLCCSDRELVSAGGGARNGAAALNAAREPVSCPDGARIDASGIRCTSNGPAGVDAVAESERSGEALEPCAQGSESWGPRVEIRDDTSLFSEGGKYGSDWPRRADGSAMPDANDPARAGASGWRKPAGGWYVAPIHATLLPDGRALLTGWGRRWHDHCGIGRDGRFDRYEGGRLYGASFVLDPAELTSALPRLQPPAEYPGSANPATDNEEERTYLPHSKHELTLTRTGGGARSFMVDENPKPRYQHANGWYTRDVLYCAGHASLSDERVLFAGGARYQNLGIKPGTTEADAEIEDGLNYGRVFDPQRMSFASTANTMAWSATQGPRDLPAGVESGARWYPTVTRLANGMALVGGGFWGYRPTPDNTTVGAIANPTLDLYEPSSGRFTSLVGEFPASSVRGAQNLLNPGLRDYSHTILLPRPISRGGISYDLISMGSGGRMVLLSSAPGVPLAQRFVIASDEPRPAGGAQNSTAALVSTPSGYRIMVMGGNGGESSIDLFDPEAGTWTTTQAHVPRGNAASVLLPDGRVLLINGYTRDVVVGGAERETMRAPEIFDPSTGSSEAYAPWPEDRADRGYHNWALLLKDGRILIGGGMASRNGATQPSRDWTSGAPGNIWHYSDIGCERSDLRIFEPRYLAKGRRPVIPSSVREGQELPIGGAPLRVSYDGPALRSPERGGIVLMALGSLTHGFDQNQRYVKLSYSCGAAGEGSCSRGPDGRVTLTISPPADASVAPPGGYMMYFVSEEGVPSVATYVKVPRGAR